ncbi:ammonium transporter [Acinetobacter puyangensis]|uniref:ammonium transporter n=1 Tax=Acinetobacter puyangensis TaxID=1096779 RepID=UPI003A4E2CDC
MHSEYTVYWVVGLIILFLLGSIFSLKVSPREKALGLLRDNARKMGLHPRLIPAPEWSNIPPASETRASIVAYYSILVPEGKFPLLRAVNQEGQLSVVKGDPQFNGEVITLKGIYAIDMQANCVGIYWDESADFAGEQLENMKNFLHSLARQATQQ